MAKSPIKVQVCGVETAAPGERRARIANLVRLLSGPQPEQEREILSSSTGRATQQTQGPITFAERPGRVVGHIEDDEEVSFLLEDGSVVPALSGKTHAQSTPGGIVGEMASNPRKRRRQMARNQRPGKGGRHLKKLSSSTEKDLEKYGQIDWEPASDGARLGLIHCDPTGDTVIMCRVSSDEGGDTLVGQLAPTFALCAHHSLKIRLVILSENMSGARAVRADREPAAPRDIPMRDDIHLLDSLVEQEGWPKNVVLRGTDRIARDSLAMATILRRWERYGLALWLAESGRKMDYEADFIPLTAHSMLAVAERMAIAKRTRTGALRKGPERGLGWIGKTRFGFFRDEEGKLKPDSKQWPFILRAFELADPGSSGESKSMREIAAALKEEGCTFDHDRVRTILQDPIYATGEFTIKVSGQEQAQTPVALDDPVPIDRFERVRNARLARRAASKKTPLGEFVLNGIELRHERCLELDDERPSPRIAGRVRPKSERRTYRHHSKVPGCCKGMTWERDEIEGPVIEYLRELAQDPEVVAALTAASSPEVADTATRLSEHQRQEIEREIEALENEKDSLVEQLAESVASGGALDPETFKTLSAGLDKSLESRRLRLQRDEISREREDDATNETFRKAFLYALTVETPADEEARILRARIVQECISRVVIDDSDEEELKLTVYGPLVPRGAAADGVDPVSRSSHLLRTNGSLSLHTDLSALADKSVCTSDLHLANRKPRECDRANPAWSTVIRAEHHPCLLE